MIPQEHEGHLYTTLR